MVSKQFRTEEKYGAEIDRIIAEVGNLKLKTVSQYR